MRCAVGMYQISSCIWFRVEIWSVNKLDNFTYLLFCWLLRIESVDSLAAPCFRTRRWQAQTCNFWLLSRSSLGVQVKLVLSPNYWVPTQTVWLTQLSLSYISICYPINFASGRIVKIAVWYISIALHDVMLGKQHELHCAVWYDAV